MDCFLRTVQHQDLDQRTGMQASGCRIEAYIGRHRFLAKKLIECDFVRNLVDEAPLAHDAQEVGFEGGHILGSGVDRKSTRLNSSHVKISYAVFCLNKK